MFHGLQSPLLTTCSSMVAHWIAVFGEQYFLYEFMLLTNARTYMSWNTSVEPKKIRLCSTPWYNSNLSTGWWHKKKKGFLALNLGLQDNLQMLYVLRFLHQTTTMSLSTTASARLYVLRFLHQTTTGRGRLVLRRQLYVLRFLHQTTTQNTAPLSTSTLYVLRFLHQTTTDVCI